MRTYARQMSSPFFVLTLQYAYLQLITNLGLVNMNNYKSLFFAFNVAFILCKTDIGSSASRLCRIKQNKWQLRSLYDHYMTNWNSNALQQWFRLRINQCIYVCLHLHICA